MEPTVVMLTESLELAVMQARSCLDMLKATPCDSSLWGLRYEGIRSALCSANTLANLLDQALKMQMDDVQEAFHA